MNHAASCDIHHYPLLALQLEDVHNEQSDADFYILHELIKDYLSLLVVVKVINE